MPQIITFQNILDDLPVSKSRKAVYRKIIDPVIARIAEVERNNPVSDIDVDDFIERAGKIFNDWVDPRLKDEHRKEVNRRLYYLMATKIGEWEKL